MRSRALVALAASLASTLAAGSSFAAGDTPPSLDLRGFHAPKDPSSGLYLEQADSGASGEWNSALWFHYMFRPITLRDPTAGGIAFHVINHQLTADAAISVAAAHRVTFGLDVPVLLYQSGDDPTPDSLRAIGGTGLPRQALGDIGLGMKLTLVRPTANDLGGFALALDDRFTLPSGDQASYLGEGAVTNEVRLLGEYRLVALGVHVALGVKIRGQRDNYACAAVSDEDCPARFGHEMPFGLGFVFRPQALGIDPNARWAWYLETHGHLSLFPSAPFTNQKTSAGLVSLAARYNLGGDASLLAGVETAYVKGIGTSPLHATLSIAWAPRNHDADGDGVPDDIDQCKQLPEDKDGFQDADGCPEFDNDDDGVPDAQDKCPTAKEDEDGFEDDDGCPDPDNDNDGIPDEQDACPNQAGPKSDDPKKNGCPVTDKDGDGIPDDVDACPTEAGKPSTDPKQNGCANPDSDGDGVPDASDACPAVKGIASEDASANGCPDPDRDHDTILDADDKCPDQPETWNGFEDADGCPDQKPKAAPLVTIRVAKDKSQTFELSKPIKVDDKNEIDKDSDATLRAMATELLAHPKWILTISAKAKKNETDAEAMARAKAVAARIAKLARRSSAAIAVTAKDLAPGASDFGFRIASP